MYPYSIGDHVITEGKDYNTDSRFVTFPPGVTHVSFNVTIINDYEVEENEDFQLVILLQQSNKRIMSGRHRRVRVIIMDDDEGWYIAIEIYFIHSRIPLSVMIIDSG